MKTYSRIMMKIQRLVRVVLSLFTVMHSNFVRRLNSFTSRQMCLIETGRRSQYLQTMLHQSFFLLEIWVMSVRVRVSLNGVQRKRVDISGIGGHRVISSITGKCSHTELLQVIERTS